jgi:tetratricopeptide (TPR) repeat protein
MYETNKSNFCDLVITTADSYIKSDRWTDAIQLIKYTATIQGLKSIPVSKLFKKVSKDAISCLEISKTLKILLELKDLVEDTDCISLSDKCSLYNNLACAYRRVGRLVQAQRFIEKALGIANTHKSLNLDRACTYLNSSTVFSDMLKHAKAAESAYKAIEICNNSLGSDIEMQKICGIACFNYASEKEALNDVQESIKYYNKCISILETVPDMENMINEVKNHCSGLVEQIKPKPRPLSSNIRSRLIAYKVADKDFIKLNRFKREKSANSNIIKTPGDSKLIVDAKYPEIEQTALKEIRKIFKKPPVAQKRFKSANRTRVNKSGFRITSQSGVNVYPSRPQSGIHRPQSDANVQNKLIEVFEIQNQQGISVLSCVSPAKNEKEKSGVDNNNLRMGTDWEFNQISPGQRLETVKDSIDVESKQNLSVINHESSVAANEKLFDIFSDVNSIEDKQFVPEDVPGSSTKNKDEDSKASPDKIKLEDQQDFHASVLIDLEERLWSKAVPDTSTIQNAAIKIQAAVRGYIIRNKTKGHKPDSSIPSNILSNSTNIKSNKSLENLKTHNKVLDTPSVPFTLIYQGTKSINNTVFSVNINQFTHCFKIMAQSYEKTSSMHLPIKEIKNFPNFNLICTHILLRLTLSESGRLCMYEENENRVYFTLDLVVNSSIYSISINKEAEKCLIRAFNIETKSESLLFIENLNVPNEKLESFAERLRIIKVSGEDSLVLTKL